MSVIKDYFDIADAQKESWLSSQDWYKRLPVDKKYKCQFCEDTGLIVDGARARRCPCRIGIDPVIIVPETYFALSEQVKNWEGWPVLRFKEVELNPKFVQTATLAKGRYVYEEMLKKNNHALCLCGGTGRGKTYTGLMVLAEAAWLGRKCYAVRLRTIIDLIKGGLDAREELDAVMERIDAASAILIDEIGSARRENEIDHGQRILAEIVDRFHAERKILIMTCNYTKKELLTVFHPAVISRISRNAGWCLTVEEPIGSKDLRGTL